MSVYKRKWKYRGAQREAWICDNLIDGKQQRLTFHSEAEARNADVEVMARARGLLPKLNPKKSVLFKDFVEDFNIFSRSNNKPSVVYHKEWILRLHLCPFFDHMELENIGPAEIERYKALKLEQKQAVKSINNQLAVLRKLLNLAVDYNKLSHAPKVRALRMNENDVDFLSFEETTLFLAHVPAEHLTMATVALKTGLRIGEILALKWEDLDLQVGRLVVKRTLWNGIENSPKGNRRREVPLSPATTALLKAHRHLRGPYVFCNEDGSRLSHNQMKRVVPTACRQAGLAKTFNWHGLRHTFASHLVMLGRSMKEVQELLGHSTISMTMRYAHLSPEVKRAAVEVLDRASGEKLPPGKILGVTCRSANTGHQ